MVPYEANHGLQKVEEVVGLGPSVIYQLWSGSWSRMHDANKGLINVSDERIVICLFNGACVRPDVSAHIYTYL